MMMRRFVLSILLMHGFVSHPATAEPVFFPGPVPIITKEGEIPAWMAKKDGDDGYVRITAEVLAPSGRSCIPLGTKGIIADSDVQLVLSLTAFGFGDPQETKEIPFATFDSRGFAGECISPVKLPTSVVPLTRLEERPAENPGQMRILLNVRSSTKTSSKLVEKAGLALSAVAVLATGGAANTVAGLTAKLTNTAIAPVIKEFEQYASNITAGTATIPLDWRMLRSAPQSYVFRVYEADAGLGTSPAKVIADLQNDNLNPAQSRFEVRFTVSYVRTIFDDLPVGEEFLPRLQQVQRARVLNHPPNSAIPNLLQTLNASSPSPLATVTSGPSLTGSCNEIEAKLQKQVGLNSIDRAVALKSFVDEALKGDSWLLGDDFKNCFQDLPSTRGLVISIYNVPKPAEEFDVADMQRDQSPDFKNWKAEVEGPMAEFRRAMTAGGAKESLLLSVFGAKDVQIGIYPKAGSWPMPVAPKPAAAVPDNPAKPAAVQPELTLETPALDSSKYPGIARLAVQPLKLGGCFVWAHAADKNINAGAQPKAHMLFAGDKDVWLADLTFSSSKPRQIVAVALTEIDSTEGDWIYLIKNLRVFGVNAQCEKIKPMLPT